MADTYYWASGLLNDHSWYHINNAWDLARATLWCMANLITAWCYAAIPYELWKWRAELHIHRFRAASYITIGFAGFIFFCGSHHVVDVIIMPTAPWWAIWSVNVPMAITSLVTWEVIRQRRDLIIAVIRAIGEGRDL